jgi:hypothetical protein
MKAERWKQINDLFQSAVERAPKQRAAFLDEAQKGILSFCGVAPGITAIRRRTHRARILGQRKGAKRKCDEDESGSGTENREK